VPTSVAVVTATDAHGPVGMTVGSFTSISLDPPLVGFFADCGSSTLARVQAGGSFCVNVLTDSQHHLCGVFAARVEDRFEGIDIVPAHALSDEFAAPHRAAPHLAEAMAWVDCHIESVTEIGDHALVVGRVSGLEVAPGNRRPLVFFRGSLCHLDRRTLPSKGNWQLDHYAEW
ncbi:MAG TPA: flavin reductase family protein, partial [Nocardioides sp.]